MRPLPLLSAALALAVTLPLRAEEPAPAESSPSAAPAEASPAAQPAAASGDSDDKKREPAPDADPSAPRPPTGSSDTPAMTPPASPAAAPEPTTAAPPAAPASPEGSAAAPAAPEAKPVSAEPAPAADAKAASEPAADAKPASEPAPAAPGEATGGKAPAGEPKTTAAEPAKPVRSGPVTSDVVEAAPVTASPAPQVAGAPEAAPANANATPNPVENPAVPPTPTAVATGWAATHTEYLNEFGLELGWNAPAGWGVRYLRRFEGTSWEAGAGLALSLWGPKLSLAVRHQPDVQRGFFQQVSFGMSGGQDGVTQPVTLADGSSVNAVFNRTPGRTLDFVAGYRWDHGGSYLDAFAGYSVNLKGTMLQDASKSHVPIDDVTKSALNFLAPGGIVWGASYGWLF